LHFSVVQENGEPTFKINIEDDGSGMDEDQIKAFFDLGNSTRRGDAASIGEKGHGTKVYNPRPRVY
jgi:sensor histidine kinase regulating citrate/malate metabolism